MSNIKENKMGVMKINKLLISMSLPLMASMLVQALYNIVDSIFVAHYAQEALTAVSLTFPIQSLMIAIACGTGVGINSILSRRLGEKKFAQANKTATNGILAGILTAIVFSIASVFVANSFFGFFTQDAKTAEMGKIYMLTCTTLSLGIFMQIIFERLLQSTGKTFYIMISQGAGAVINIILDPIFIFGYFGLPEMGIFGAAFATVVGQWCAMLLGLYFNVAKNKEISLSLKGFKPDFKIIGDIYKIGIPSIIMQSLMSVMTMSMNKILASDDAVSVLGIYFKVQSFIFMPVFGLTNALVPIVAYNYGAKNKKRITDALKLSTIIVCSIMAFGTAMFMVFPKLFLDMFKANENMYALGIPALRIISSSFVASGVSIVICSAFQALGDAFISMVISILRQLFIVIPSAFLLKMLWGFPAVWASIPLAEFVAVFICTFTYIKVYKKKIKTL